MIHDCASALREGRPPRSAVRPAIVGAAGAAAVLYHAGQLLQQRDGIVQQWSDQDKAATLPASIGVAAANGADRQRDRTRLRRVDVVACSGSSVRVPPTTPSPAP